MEKEEKETIILMNEEDNDAIIYTTSPSMRKKLVKQFKNCSRVNIIREEKEAYEISCPKCFITIRKTN